MITHNEKTETAPGAEPHRSRPPGRMRGALLPALLLGALALAACEDLDFAAPQVTSCSARRLDLAAGMYQEAKELLAIYFKERRNNYLVMAYYISEDVEALSKTIKGCLDFREWKSEAVDIIRASRMFRRIVLVNLRDTDPAVMTTILSDQYEDTFKNDIR